MGLDVVVWWDKNDNNWKVFDDKCPHRLAPLSEGRIDQWGRLQCVYHGWCFDGSGDCKLIPQAPLDGPLVHSFSKACVGVYPSTVQNGIVWFWPNTDPQYKDILTEKKPPYVPELDDPSFLGETFTRDIPYGCDFLIENLMDPSHESSDSTQENSAKTPPRKHLFVFYCIPVSPSNCRLICLAPRNFTLWIDPFITRWMHHVMQNLVIDSDMYLVRVQEEKLMKAGPSNWHKVCFVPTKADTMVTLYRTWLKKYAGGQVVWGTQSIPSIPPKEQLMDRYWSHVVHCSSCTSAYKGLNALKISFQVFSVALVAILGATKPGMISIAARNTLAVAAILCFVGSKWLSHFIYKNFHFHDYNHAFK
ncbi:hypothetical protein QVD17_37732 [Tagetes erecta]|uniref:Rieske domain-containing protein n=1 Tax=Tagetes erecta TaxID=13708 RepID=A0AAD8JX96_TARER|nr:hypothetical protein QVD17_37732 [Tagetes erecta]